MCAGWHHCRLLHLWPAVRLGGLGGRVLHPGGRLPGLAALLAAPHLGHARLAPLVRAPTLPCHWSPVSPAVCRISDKERQYIEAGLPATDKDSVAIPWKGIWTSMAFWAILVANFANNWGFHLLLTELPQYLSEIFPDYMNTGTKQGE